MSPQVALEMADDERLMDLLGELEGAVRRAKDRGAPPVDALTCLALVFGRTVAAAGHDDFTPVLTIFADTARRMHAAERRAIAARRSELSGEEIFTGGEALRRRRRR